MKAKTRRKARRTVECSARENKRERETSDRENTDGRGGEREKRGETARKRNDGK